MHLPKIHVLGEETITQIAAGEVIESPFSVVKELVENALDAGADAIHIDLEDGGTSAITVSDNGCGIPRSELKKSYQRHATSKISTASDISTVQTMGFRGEALSSIASVSEIGLQTHWPEDDTGWELSVSGGKELACRPISRSKGTTISVRNLFFNVPVRKKYLKSAASELTKSLKVLEKLALSNPQVGIEITHNHNPCRSYPKCDLKTRVGEILGKAFSREMMPVDWSNSLPSCQISGFIGHPDHATGSRLKQHFFINGRSIFSPMLSSALARGFDRLPLGKFPAGVLFIDLPELEVDVNIHPAKREVRFLKEKEVFSSVVSAVRQAFQASLENPGVSLEPNKQTNASPADQPKFTLSIIQPESLSESDQTEQTHLNLGFKEPSKAAPESTSENLISWRASQKVSNTSPANVQTPAVPFLQLHKTYILFEVKSGLMIVHQKYAHERILYEQALSTYQIPGRLSSQQLLFPEILDFNENDAALMSRALPGLQNLGFVIEPFGGSSFRLRGIPVELAQNKARAVVFEMVENLESFKNREPDWMARIALAFARGLSISEGDILDNSQMASLMDRLFATKNPYVSPSGHMIIMPLRMSDIKQRFKKK